MTIRILVGDCREVMKTLADSSVDSIVCDPPYELGFMSKSWDSTGVANDVETWRQCLRVLKPGGHLLAFGGTRTNHRMVCAIEDAGFEIRDQAAWLYGSGFPKSLDVSKAIDKAAGVARDLTRPGVIQRDGYGEDWDTGSSSSRPRRDAPATSAAKQWEGWGTALKPAYEPICMARKPLAKGMTVAANVLAHGTGAINIDACRVPVEDDAYARNFSGDRGHGGTRDEGETGATNMRMGWGSRPLRTARSNEEQTLTWNAFGKGLAGSVAAGETSLGRWPANLLHDGSPEVVALFPQVAGQQAFVGAKHGDRPSINAFGDYGPRPDTAPRGDSGSAARFFWCSKTGKTDRNEGLEGLEGLVTDDGRNVPADNAYQRGKTLRQNTHPTVKPTKLMRYLCRLVTPPGGTVLDPFMGSGSTLKAAELEGFNAIGIELSNDYAAIARRRIGSDAPLFAQAIE